jgi:S-adenosylmethionine hydrolase
VRTYAEAPRGSVVALVGSSGLIEVAVVEGSAAAKLGLAVGSPVIGHRAG